MTLRASRLNSSACRRTTSWCYRSGLDQISGWSTHQLEAVDTICRKFVLRCGLRIHVQYLQRVDVFDQAVAGFAIQRIAIADHVEIERYALADMSDQQAA